MFYGRLKDYHLSDNQADIFNAEQQSLVDTLHQASKNQLKQLVPFGLDYLWQRIRRRPVSFEGKPFQSLTLGIDPRQGRLLYNLCLMKRPQVILEYGTSYGISTLYMAKALHEIGSGHIYTCELEPQKIARAHANFVQSKLDNTITILEGDIRSHLNQFNKKIDLVFMDGFPGLNMEVLDLLEPYLEAGGLIITDDALLFGLEMQNYLRYIQNSNQYTHFMLPMSTGVLLATKKSSSRYKPSAVK